MQAFGTVMIAAILVQAIVEIVKKPLPETIRGQIAPFLSVLFAELICVFGQVDMLAAAGIYLAPTWISLFLSGLIVSGGSTAVNELIKALAESRPSNREEVEFIPYAHGEGNDAD